MRSKSEIRRPGRFESTKASIHTDDTIHSPSSKRRTPLRSPPDSLRTKRTSEKDRPYEGGSHFSYWKSSLSPTKLTAA